MKQKILITLISSNLLSCSKALNEDEEDYVRTLPIVTNYDSWRHESLTTTQENPTGMTVDGAIGDWEVDQSVTYSINDKTVRLINTSDRTCLFIEHTGDRQFVAAELRPIKQDAGIITEVAHSLGFYCNSGQTCQVVQTSTSVATYEHAETNQTDEVCEEQKLSGPIYGIFRVCESGTLKNCSGVYYFYHEFT